ncbi:MAG: hypothetical protein ACREPF_11455, partial [Rhodanobacteraceae bacterium]
MDPVIPAVTTSAPGAPTAKPRGESRGDADFSTALSAASGEDKRASTGASADGSKDAHRTASGAKGDKTSGQPDHRPADDWKRPPTSPVPAAIQLAGPIDKGADPSPRVRPVTSKRDGESDASRAAGKTAGKERIDPFTGIAPLLGATVAAPAASTAMAAGAKA